MTNTKPKSFIYLGKKFTPVRQFSTSESKRALQLPLRSIGISNYSGENYKVHNHISDQWSYDEFYKKASKIGAGEIDVFLMNKKEVVPCENELFELKG